jgi:hypothetical protein
LKNFFDFLSFASSILVQSNDYKKDKMTGSLLLFPMQTFYSGGKSEFHTLPTKMSQSLPFFRLPPPIPLQEGLPTVYAWNQKENK